MPPAAVAKVVVLAAAAVGRWDQGRVAGVAVYDLARDAVRLVAGLLGVGLPERVLPERVPQLGARDVVLVSVVAGVTILVRRDDRLSIVDHARDGRLRVHRRSVPHAFGDGGSCSCRRR